MLARPEWTAPQFAACRTVSRTGHILVVAILLSVVPAGAQAPSPAGSDARLGEKILALLDQGSEKTAHWGLAVVSLKDSRKLVGWNEDKFFVPASTAKIITAAAALTQLGPDFKYHTTVGRTGTVTAQGELDGDIVLVGRGDPNLSGRIFPYRRGPKRNRDPATILQKIAAQVYASGLRSIEGNLIADESYFVTQPFGSGWEVDDLLWGYAPPVTALALNDNILNIHVLPGRIAHQPARVRVELLEDYYQVENRVLTVPRTKTLPGGGSVNAERFLGVARRPGSKRVVLWGQVPVRGTGWSRQLSVEDPPEFAGEVFRRELVRRGIKISGDLIVRRSEPFDFEDLTGSARPPEPLSATVLADYLSVPLAESLKVILKTSQNLHAEMLLRTLGRERRNVGSIEAGLEQVYEFLQQMDVR